VSGHAAVERPGLRRPGAESGAGQHPAGTAQYRSARQDPVYAGLDKSDEYAADQLGVQLAGPAGYDPYGLLAVLQTLDSMDSATAPWPCCTRPIRGRPTARRSCDKSVKQPDAFGQQPTLEPRLSPAPVRP